VGRFSEDQTPDLKSGVPPEEGSRNVEALYTLACIYLQHSHEEFKEIVVEVGGEGGGVMCEEERGHAFTCNTHMKSLSEGVWEGRWELVGIVMCGEGRGNPSTCNTIMRS